MGYVDKWSWRGRVGRSNQRMYARKANTSRLYVMTISTEFNARTCCVYFKSKHARFSIYSFSKNFISLKKNTLLLLKKNFFCVIFCK